MANCKMCGAALNIKAGSNVCVCEYCDTKQTVHVAGSDEKSKFFERANKYRMACHFDKASAVYEDIIKLYEDDPEGYWGHLLCEFGIEYVTDPATGNKIPTCHRSSFTSFLNNEDFEMVMQYSDDESRRVYREQAKAIEEVRKGIVKVSENEEPYDIFICYKETDSANNRTIDSVMAQEVYENLVNSGYKVFFSRITLEDKLGVEYEPYIFAALNSAKIMLVFGTSYDNFQAVWVKNEWSRFLKLMSKDKTKVLIPCFKNVDAYDIPEEFKAFQAQDMGKVGANQDLIRGIEKILGSKNVAVSKSPDSKLQALIKRGDIALEDKLFNEADEFYEQALNINPECSEAYLGKLLVKNKVSNYSEYISSLKAKYSAEEFVDVTIENKTHIADMCKKYSVPKVLDSNKIAKMYEENYTYKSSAEFCKKQKKQLLDELENEAFLARASRFATGQTKSKIGDGINGIVVELDNKIKNATNSDAANKNKIEKKIKAIDDKVIELNQASTQKKEEPKAKPASEIAETKTETKTETKPETKEEKKKGKMVLGIVAALVALIVIATSVFGVYGYSKTAKEVKNVQIGSIIEFGNYGGEKITWRVLDVVDGKAFVVAEDAVDLGYFNETNEAVIWEDSDIRNFLNDSFYSSAFGLFEKNRILNTNSVSNTLTSTKITTDKVFLLSAGEVESYLAGKIKKTTCSPNSYAASKGIDFDNNKCWYWLRDTGMEDYRALVVVSDGSTNVWGFEVAAPDGGIRPAMWIKIS